MKIHRALLFSTCLFSLVCLYSFEERYSSTFRCESGAYIGDDHFCDGDISCSGGEDEGFGCSFKGPACGVGKFSCDGKCKPITVRCNTIKDCQDGTDELNCGDEINVKNCTSDDKFLCKDGLRCLSMQYTCDDRCNCFDCSDENSNCLKTDPVLLKKCPNSYFRTPDGPRCFCDPNAGSSSNSTFCSRIERCEYFSYTRPKCDQRCIRFKQKSQCSCNEGYQPINEILGIPCRSTDNFRIIYATELEIKSLNNTSQMTSTILHGISNCTMLKAANNYVYYATLSHDNKGSIFKTAINSGKAEKLIETNFPITSMAVDYITSNVYFTSNGSLSVCGSNGRLCMQLKSSNITSVTLAPKSGWIFYMQMETHQDKWCQTGSFLTRLNMDGSNETTSRVQCYERGYTIEMDESTNILYLLRKYSDDQTQILKVAIDPAFKSAPLSSNFNNIALGEIKHFSFYNNEIFFTILPRTGIFYYSKSTSQDYIWSRDSPPIYLNDNSTSAISGLYVYSGATQTSEENPCDKSSCAGLCLLKPEVRSSKHLLSHSCLCDHFTPTDNNHWCPNPNGTEGAV